MIKPKLKTKSPNFSSGPTKKPDSWSLNGLDKSLLGRYHRSNYISDYVDEILSFAQRKALFRTQEVVLLVWL